LVHEIGGQGHGDFQHRQGGTGQRSRPVQGKELLSRILAEARRGRWNEPVAPVARPTLTPLPPKLLATIAD
jgi:hypothetical protein